MRCWKASSCECFHWLHQTLILILNLNHDRFMKSILILTAVYCYCNVEAIMRLLIFKNFLYLYLCAWTHMASCCTGQLQRKIRHDYITLQHKTIAGARPTQAWTDDVDPTTTSCLAVFEILTHSVFFSLAHTLTKTARHETKTTTNHTTKWSYSRAARSTWITIHETLHSTCPYSHVHKLYSSIMKCLKNHQYFKKLRDVASTVTQSP